MNRHFTLVGIAALALCSTPGLTGAEAPPTVGAGVKSMFDGQTLAGWEGSPKLWNVQDGALTGGSLTETVKRNEFLATTRDYTNFIVRFKIKLAGTNGFINSGFQIRSQRVPNNSEMAGYQCDFGEPNWYGAIYDESRRNKVMASSDMKALRPVIKRGDWNDYVIRADGPRVTTWINGVMGVDYFEPDMSLPNYDWGKLGIQVHGGGKAVVQVKDITIEELPVGRRFIGAPEPKKGAKASPLTPDEERAAFTLPPGFEIELVAEESEGIGKFVAVDWDWHGNLWTMTALEYPVDANENAATAKELYASKAKDKVVVFDRNPKSPTGYSRTPRVFADGLAIPLGILPYKNGVYVQHGPDIVFLSDTDGDGKADKREVILSGFGVQDSHLFPHQFTRAPGGWIWMAQGAFNYGKVRTKDGKEQQFDQTRMAKFHYDGSEFEITSQGPCNIWGLVLTAEGEAWIQEANDYGYPVMPFHEYANYPGCSDAQMKSYAPEFPGTAPDFQMGGTGLSGLALTDPDPTAPDAARRAPSPLGGERAGVRGEGRPSTFPAPYADVMYVANPITRKIQAIKITRDGPRFRYQKLPDFVQSSDEWFRPVALRLGPDGCLYFVDWYNKIISHNEVPRNHPERDKKRGRIWRVKHQDAKPLDVPDFMKLTGDELLAKLGGENTPQSHLAWQAIGDRQMVGLAPKLRMLVGDKSQPAGRRIASLWALEGLAEADRSTLKPLLADANRNIRREGVRTYGEHHPEDSVGDLEPALGDPDPHVRAETIRTGSRMLRHAAARTTAPDPSAAVGLLARFARAPLDGPTMKSTQNGRTIKTGDAYDREFERYLVRLSLEQQPSVAAAFLKSAAVKPLPVENLLVASLALEPKVSAAQVAKLLPQLTRPPGQEELLRLAQFPDEPGVGDALKKVLQQPATSTAAIEGLLKVRTKLDAARLTPLLLSAARELWTGKDAKRELALRLTSSFKLAGMEDAINEALSAGSPALADQEVVPALRALRELGASKLEGVVAMVKSPRPEVADEAVAALAASRNAEAPQFLLNKFWGDLSASQRRVTLTSLAGTKPGGQALVKAVRSGPLAKDDLDAATLDKLHAVLGDDPDLAALMQEMASFFRPALRLDGSDNAWSDTDITLDGPFTVETWVKLDAGIDNNDGILGAPGAMDMNFFGGQFRVWAGGGVHDAIVAKKKITADAWTHLAVTRDADGRFRIYLNGELDNDQGKPVKDKFEHCRLAWTAPAKGTAGWLSEFRVWNRLRTADELRADFDRSFENEGQASRLPNSNVSQRREGTGETPALLFTGTNWGKLHGGAKVVKTSDFPPLLTPAEAEVLAEKFTKFRTLAEKPGDSTRGQAAFKAVCMACHSVAGQGGQVGPVLNGAGANGVEALLRNIVTPNAAMEAGYRAYRVELKDGDVLDGLRVSEDKDAIVLRRPNMEDTRIAQRDVRRAAFTKSSMMPEGLLEALKPGEVADLFAYLKALK